MGLGVPRDSDRPTSTRDGITIKYQQFEREDSARPIPPWPWPIVNLLDTPEKHSRLELMWKESEQVRTRYVTSVTIDGADTAVPEAISCDLCAELFIVNDSATLIEECNLASFCSPHARAHMDCRHEVDKDIISGGWCCGVCSSETVTANMDEDI